MKRRVSSFLSALNGLRVTWREEMNFRIEIALGVSVILIGSALRFSIWEWMWVVVCVTAVLAAELVNTAIEDLCDKVEPNQDPAIGKIKDISAAFVLVVCTGVAFTALGLILIHLIEY